MKPYAAHSRPGDPERIAANWVLRRDAGLDPAEEIALQVWLSEDPRNAVALARKEKAWSVLGRPLQSGQAGVLLQRLEASAARRRRRRRHLATCTAAVALFVVGAFFLSRSDPMPVAREGQGIVVRPERRTLADGSVVELRPGAQIEVDFSDLQRRVWLRSGAAYFEVAKNPERPFVVNAGQVEFRALGTAFAVELGGAEVDLVVTEGRVAVDRPRAAPPADSTGGAKIPVGEVRDSSSVETSGERETVRPVTTVDSGNRLVVGLGAALAGRLPVPTAITAREIGERLAWRAPKLEFSELPLGEAIKLMNRYNQVRFEIRDPKVAQMRISGLFRADNVETFVRLLEGTCGLEAQRDGDLLLLRKAGDK